MIFKTDKLILAAAVSRDYKGRDNTQRVFRSARMIDAGDGSVFEASLSEDVFNAIKDIKAATGTATLEIVSRSKDGRSYLSMSLLAFED